MVVTIATDLLTAETIGEIIEEDRQTGDNPICTTDKIREIVTTEITRHTGEIRIDMTIIDDRVMIDMIVTSATVSGLPGKIEI